MQLRRPNIVADADIFRLLCDNVDIGVIRELSPSDASLIAPHIGSNNETLFVACSGVNINSYPNTFRTGERQLAIEWVRREPNPVPGEPELNVNRFIFGLTQTGECHGYDVTEKAPGVSREQVADHWTTLNNIIAAYLS
jgi:hypothetical protein